MNFLGDMEHKGVGGLLFGVIDSEYARVICDILRSVKTDINVIIIDGNADNTCKKHLDVLIADCYPSNGHTVLECSAVVLNADDSELLRLLKGAYTNCVTYGFNARACITVSSVSYLGNGAGIRAVFCVQRVFRAAGKDVPETEFVFGTSGLPLSQGDLLMQGAYAARCLLPAVSALLVSGVLRTEDF